MIKKWGDIFFRDFFWSVYIEWINIDQDRMNKKGYCKREEDQKQNYSLTSWSSLVFYGDSGAPLTQLDPPIELTICILEEDRCYKKEAVTLVGATSSEEIEEKLEIFL